MPRSTARTATLTKSTTVYDAGNDDNGDNDGSGHGLPPSNSLSSLSVSGIIAGVLVVVAGISTTVEYSRRKTRRRRQRIRLNLFYTCELSQFFLEWLTTAVVPKTNTGVLMLVLA